MEILKRHYELHQVTRLGFQRVEENWVPIVEGLDDIVVKRQIPAIHILTSLDPLDPATPGYQFSKEKTSFAFKPQPRVERPYNLLDQRNPRPKNKPRNDKSKDEKGGGQKNAPKKRKGRKQPGDEPTTSSSNKLETETAPQETS